MQDPEAKESGYIEGTFFFFGRTQQTNSKI